MKNSPNILFIIIDALRTVNLGCYGYFKPTSPNIDDIARDGILFERAYSCANATDPSLTSIFSGKYPVSHGIVHQGLQVTREEVKQLDQSGTQFLSEILRSINYITTAVDWMSRWHSRGYDHRPGQEKITGTVSGSLKQHLTRFPRLYRFLGQMRGYVVEIKEKLMSKPPIEDAGIVTNYAAELIEKNVNKKFFLFLHYWDTHTPYFAPEEYVEMMRDNYTQELDVEKILEETPRKKRKAFIRRMFRNGVNEPIARYNASIAYIDHEIGRLMQMLKDHGLLDDTLIILTADHGESLTEHGIYFDHHGIYDTTVHVPLILKGPELPGGRRIAGLVQHTDIVPTILDLLDMNVREFNFDGKSLLPMIRNKRKQVHPAVYTEDVYTERKRAVITEDYKYIYVSTDNGAMCRSCKRPHGEVEELYNLNEDPNEKRNILKEKMDIAKKLQEQLHLWIKSLEHKRWIRERIRRLKASGEL